jgi:hypothetical protein
LYAVYSDNTADTSNKPVPIIPEEFLKYFLPNSPSKTNPAKGRRGIKAM